MKPVLKILKLSAILIFTISVILFSASLLMQDKVAGIILNSLNRNISTKLDIGSFRLSFLRKFPNASLELKNVVVHSSSNFNSEEFTGINTDTLLAAKFVSVEFRITDIIKGNYNIDRVGVKMGRANFYTDNAGFVNYNISVNSDNKASEVFTINLERINVNDITLYYNNLGAKLIMTGFTKSGKLKSRISGEKIDFTAKADLDITRFQLYNTIITQTIKTGLDVTLQSSKSGILFRKGVMTVENFDLGLDGFVSSDDMLDLNITGKNIDLSRIRKYLPEKYLSSVSNYDPKGLLIADCKIKGPLTRTKNPHVEINFLLNNGRIAYGKSDLTIKNLSFSGQFSNGLKNNFETSSVLLKNIKATLGSSEYTGSVKISGFNHPKTEIILKGRVFPDELKEYFDIQSISKAYGSVDVDLKVVTDFWPKDSITQNDIIDLKPDGNLVFNSFSIGLQKNKLLINNVNGTLSFSDIIRAEKMSFSYRGQEIKVDGEFRNLPEWLGGRHVNMIAKADVSFNRLVPEMFRTESTPSVAATSEKKAFNMPGDIILDVNFKIDSLRYKTFSSSKITGTLNYKPRLLTFKSFNMKSLNGTIAGNGFIVQNSSKSVIARGSFNITDIDVNKAFKSFRNFGQDFIKAENLTGNLSGTLAVLLPMDSLLNPQIKSLTAEGKYLLVNGALINFDPVKELSAFIELSELENIHFEKLENDFFIRNNFLYLPQMDVKSSAADLSVNGKHSFDNDYEYHVKILLSEILSKQRKKNKNNVTEFGVIQDDGLGRTSILLKVVGKGEELKVGYDVKAMSVEVKNNMKSEKQNIKSILNQEYGWFKSDTSVTKIPAEKKPAEKKSRFRISWDETDSTKNATNPPVVKKKLY
jgi:hypothetical protein